MTSPTRKNILTTIILAALTLCTTHAAAQITPYTFTLDETLSHLQVRGDVLGFKLIGDRDAAFGGTFDTRLGNPVEPFRGFIIDNSFILQLDPYEIDIKNPIPFFPPIGHISITDISMSITTAPIPLDQNGNFVSNSGALEILSGTASGDLLGTPFDPVDLTGNGSSNLPIAGTLIQSDNLIILDLPLTLDLNTPDFNLSFTGGFTATTPIQ